jgi:peptidyl-prolyl cis-trans isomerase D
VQFQRFDPAAYRAKVNPSDAEVEAFFKQQEAQFKAPEQASIEYVVLDMEALAKGLKPQRRTAQVLRRQHRALHRAEERRASHILIKADKDARRPNARRPRRAPRNCWPRLRKNPAGFADLARKNSQDSTRRARRRPGLLRPRCDGQALRRCHLRDEAR